ncbi:MAG: hypothetical protein R2821_11950 [Flavobacteriaceae bacterium]
MKRLTLLIIITSIIFATSCKKDKMTTTDAKPPIAEKIPKELENIMMCM